MQGEAGGGWHLGFFRVNCFQLVNVYRSVCADSIQPSPKQVPGDGPQTPPEY